MTDQPGNPLNKKNETGSPKSGEPVSIAIGKVRRPHGVKGEVIFEPYPEYSVVLKKDQVVQIGKKKQNYQIRSIRNMDQNYLIAFEGYEDCDVISHLRNQIVFINKTELKSRANGQKYPHQVLGMNVIDEKDQPIGVLNEVLLTGANDVYVVLTPGEEEILLPAIDSVILKVDPEKKTITVRLPVWE